MKLKKMVKRWAELPYCSDGTLPERDSINDYKTLPGGGCPAFFSRVFVRWKHKLVQEILKKFVRMLRYRQMHFPEDHF
jgi:hypothetical protein